MSYSFATNTITQANSDTQSISAVADAGGSLLDLTVADSSAYSADDLAVVTGTTSYNGQYLIDSIPNATTIRIPDTDVRGNQNAFGSTETGTVDLGDASLDGLTGLTGVTKTTVGGVSYYSIASSSAFVVNGNICYDTESECLLLEESTTTIQATINGSFIAGRVLGTNADGSDRYSIGVGLITPNDGGAVNREVMSPGASGEIIFYGNEVRLGTGIGVADSPGTGTIDFYGTTLVNISPTTFTHLGRSEGDPNGISYYNVKLDGTTLSGNIFTKNGTNQLSGEFLNASLQNRFGSHTNAATYEGLTFAKNFASQDWVIFGNSSNDDSQAIEVTNCDIGTGIRTGFDVANREGHMAIFQKINITVLDTSAAAIEDAKIRIASTDNGNQVNSTRGDATGKFQNNRDFTLGTFDLYTATTNASGLSGELTILTGRIWSDDGAGTIEYDLYSKTNTAGTDDFDAKYCSYLHNLKTTEFILQSDVTLTPNDILVTDPLITETTKATVDAYTTIDNAREFYDRAKSYLYDNFAGETATFVTRSGTEIDLGAYDLTIDATAGSVFAIAGNTITIKSTVYTGDLITTGTVTLTNGASVVGLISDSAVDSALQFSGIDTWQVYLTNADRNADTNEDANGGVTDLYRFTYVPATVYYLRLTVSGEVIFKDVTPVAVGTTEVDLSTSSILLGVSEKLGFINRIIYCDTSLATNGSGANNDPFNDLDDAIDLFNSGVYSYIDLKTPLLTPATPSNSLAGVQIVGSSLGAGITMASNSCQGARLEGLFLQGTQAAADTLTLYANCTFIADYTNVVGNVSQCQFASLVGADITITASGSVAIVLANITNAGDTIFSIPSGSHAAFRSMSGDFQISDISAGSMVSVDSNLGKMTINASCVGGTLRVNDTMEVIDNSAGVTVDIEDVPSTEWFEANVIPNIDALPSAGDVADAVFDEPRADHVAAGSFGQSLQLIRSGTAQAGANGSITLDASASSINSFYNNTVVQIISGTGVGQSRRINGYTGSTKVASVANNWQTNPDATSVFVILPRAQVNASLNTTQSAQLSAIEADTNELQTNQNNWLTATGFATPTNVTDAQSAIQTDISNLNDPSLTEIVDGIWDEPLTGATHNDPTSAGRRLRQINLPIIIEGTTVSSTSNTIVLDSDASSVDGTYDPGLIHIANGTGSGQSRLILEYNGSTKTAVINRDWKINPDNTSEYIIEAHANPNTVNEGLAQAGSSNTITLNSLASAYDDKYVGQSVWIVSGTGTDQLGLVTAYNGTTKVATIAGAWSVTPDTTSAYMMLPNSPVLLGATTHTNAVIPNVTLVDTCTTNTDMRGTDGANTTAPDNASISAIKTKTDTIPTDPASKAHLEVINTGIKDSSLFLPHTTDLP